MRNHATGERNKVHRYFHLSDQSLLRQNEPSQLCQKRNFLGGGGMNTSTINLHVKKDLQILMHVVSSPSVKVKLEQLV